MSDPLQRDVSRSRVEDAAEQNEEMKVETFTQPKITGYRQLHPDEVELMNEIKAHGVNLGALVEKLKHMNHPDQRWVSIGATDLQKGLMALTRSIAKPETF